MNSKSSGRRSEEFLMGKGFYIVLFLCATVVGISAWMMSAGNNNVEELQPVTSTRVETIVIPSEKTEVKPQEVQPPVQEVTVPENSVEVWAEETEPDDGVFVWPVVGELERGYMLECLGYDVTMRDWRTHDGIDIEAPLGTEVLSSRCGTVSDIRCDDLYGTVVEIESDDGYVCTYANLAAMPTVNIGDRVQSGEIIGSVGTSALCEIGQGTHLHFEVSCCGESIDPSELL